MHSAEKRFGTPFVPTGPVNNFQFLTDVSYAPVFKPNGYVFSPAPAYKKPAPQMQMAAFNMSDYGQSTYASSS